MDFAKTFDFIKFGAAFWDSTFSPFAFIQSFSNSLKWREGEKDLEFDPVK